MIGLLRRLWLKLERKHPHQERRQPLSFHPRETTWQAMKALKPGQQPERAGLKGEKR
jgi:hypothetical protein